MSLSDFGAKFWRAVAAAATSVPQPAFVAKIALFAAFTSPLPVGGAACATLHGVLLIVALVTTAVAARRFGSQRSRVLASGAATVGTVARNAAVAQLATALLPGLSLSPVLLLTSLWATVSSAAVRAAVFRKVSDLAGARVEDATGSHSVGTGRTGFKSSRHEILDGGPHAARTARGCLLPYPN